MWVAQLEVCRAWSVCPLVALTAAIKSRLKTAIGCGKSWDEIRKIKPWNRCCRSPTSTCTHTFGKYPEDINWTIRKSYHWGIQFCPPFFVFLQWLNIAFDQKNRLFQKMILYLTCWSQTLIQPWPALVTGRWTGLRGSFRKSWLQSQPHPCWRAALRTAST